MNTTTTHTQRLVALVDPAAPAKVKAPRKPKLVAHPDETVFAVPDFYEDERAVFIGEDATVLVDMNALAEVDLLLVRGSIRARTGHMPDELGITVYPHAEVFASPTFGRKHHEAQVAWSLVHHTLTIPA